MTTRTDPVSFVPDPQDGRMLRDAFGRFATGITLVTARGPAGMAAMTANSFSSVSMDPPLVLWSPARASARYPVFADAPHFAVHVLSADQAELAWAVARDRAGLDLAALPMNGQGVPVLDRCLARFDCAVHALHEAGDHMIMVGRVLQAHVTDDAPLAFYAGRVAGIVRD